LPTGSAPHAEQRSGLLRRVQVVGPIRATQPIGITMTDDTLPDQLAELARVADALAELDRERATLIRERDALLSTLIRSGVGAPTLSRSVALTTQAIYKIVHRDSNRTVTEREGTTAHEPIGRANGTAPTRAK
jgi:hypothetical protein